MIRVLPRSIWWNNPPLQLGTSIALELMEKDLGGLIPVDQIANLHWWYSTPLEVLHENKCVAGMKGNALWIPLHLRSLRANNTLPLGLWGPVICPPCDVHSILGAPSLTHDLPLFHPSTLTQAEGTHACWGVPQLRSNVHFPEIPFLLKSKGISKLPEWGFCYYFLIL